MTGQVRLYVSGLELGSGVKVWIEDGGDRYGVPNMPHIVIRADYMLNKAEVEQRVGKWIDANGGKGFDRLFDRLVAAVEGTGPNA
jgi:hypothetical protein